MIGRLAGELVFREGTLIIIDCAGAGYEVTLSTYSLATLPPLGERVVLRIYTQVLETKIGLYGFATPEERQLFDLLITVKRVGPTAAMSILSGGAGPAEVAQLIAGENAAALTKLKGVGKKTAEMLVVELHDKCQLLLATWGASGALPASVAGVAGHAATSSKFVRAPILEDVANALLSLGWRGPEVDKAVDSLDLGSQTDSSGDRAEPDLETLLRQALQHMPR